MDIQAELTRRHRAAATTIAGLIIAAVLLSIVAFLGKSYFKQQSNALLETALMLAILFIGLGSIVWRRTKFAVMRLQDIGALQGPLGLLITLEKTTIQLAFFGATIAALGFIATLITGNEGHTYRGTAISLVVLLYSYPTKTSWSRVISYYGESQAAQPTNNQSK
jgi:membrane protein YdbS with pleckstrin-like domain